ncbi:hypothetical protein M0P48_02090 [Candidatus Gracilibacteria bacterium]|nr:hypothetical protein [Candidatus Gracilibacteria bacterium]
MAEIIQDTTDETITPTPDATTPKKGRITPTPIPAEIEFKGDLRGHSGHMGRAIAHKTIIYKLLYRFLEKGLTPEEIVSHVNEIIANESIKVEPINKLQISGYIIGMNTELASHRLFVEKIRGKTLYRIRILEEPQKPKEEEKPKPEIEDTSINKITYFSGIRSRLPEGTYQIAIAIAEHPGIQNFDLHEKTNARNLSSKLERLNEVGSSSEVPQHFRVESRMETDRYRAKVRKYYIIVFKPHKKEGAKKTEEKQAIPELLTADTKTMFGPNTVKSVVRKLIQEVLSIPDEEISSRLKDIVHTLDTMSTAPEITRITAPLRERLEQILGKYERSVPKNFSEALIIELSNIH